METPASFKGIGDVYFDRKVSDAYTGLRNLGSVSKLEAGSKSELDEQLGNGRTTFNKVIASGVVPGKDDFSMVLDQCTKENMAMVLMGQLVNDDQEAGSVAVETPLVKAAHLGRLIEVGYEDLSAVVIKSPSGAVTYDVDDDYVITNARLGLIEPLASGTIPEGELVELSFSYGAVTRTKIEAGIDTLIEGRLVMDGMNLATGKDVKLVIPDLQIAADAVINYLSGEYETPTLNGVCRVAAGNPPFIVYEYD